MNTNNGNKFDILTKDPWLSPYSGEIELRMEKYAEHKNKLLSDGKTLSEFANGHHYYGFHRTDDGWVFREWAPGADELYLIGDFNFWNQTANPMIRLDGGVWEIHLAGSNSLRHESRVKVRVVSHGVSHDRIPTYINKVEQDPVTKDFFGQIWDWTGIDRFKWTDDEWMSCGASARMDGESDERVQGDARVQMNDETSGRDYESLLIYEAHIGMAQEREGYGTYREFTENNLRRIKDSGYNTIQLMGVMQHPYYASFGYHVSNFFAPSSWFGTPDDLKELINTAHNMGLRVLMDIIHSHAVSNTREGINEFDGTDYQFFHPGARGNHSAWGSKVFNYGKYEVIHFLLSNVKFWIEEFHFDGFRFDGVTSMIYLDHGLGTAFDNYDKYFSLNTDIEALNYLQMVNDLIDEIDGDIVTIAEDMSGMPGMCLPVSDGGIGFDYRLAMGVPDFWIKNLKNKTDEQLSMWEMWHELTTRRPYEKNIGYCESHDQALVGDKTIIFWLADKEMYDKMSVFSGSAEIDRAIALHKMYRFVTLVLGGEGYLNFIGNEFGHPEWIDFPREGNGWSFKYAQRKWSLCDSEHLKYKYLAAFDKEMLDHVKQYPILGAWDLASLWCDDVDKILAFRKGGLIYLFNFNPTRSFEGYELPVIDPGTYKVVFDSDKEIFGGFGRISGSYEYQTNKLGLKRGKIGIMIYSPSRTVIVLAKTS